PHTRLGLHGPGRTGVHLLRPATGSAAGAADGAVRGRLQLRRRRPARCHRRQGHAMTVTRPVPTGLTAPPALPAEKATCPSRRDRSGVGIAVLKRIALVPPMLLAITTFVFLAMRLIPGSPASSL